MLLTYRFCGTLRQKQWSLSSYHGSTDSARRASKPGDLVLKTDLCRFWVDMDISWSQHKESIVNSLASCLQVVV